MDNLNLQYIEGFAVQLVGDRTWAIDDFGIALMYLVEGEKCAALIDTGMGMGNLRGVVDKLTDLPVMVINTHGHGDHIGGNDEFPDSPVYVHKEDAYMLEEFPDQDHRDSLRKSFDTEGFYGQKFYDFERSFRKTGYQTIEGETEFDLGDRKLKVIEVPGHTKGSIVLLDEKNGYLFSGDAVVSTPTLIVSEMGSVDMAEYHQALIRLNEYRDQIKLIFPGHYLKPIENSYIDSLIRVCENVISGEAENEEFDLRFITDRKTVISRFRKASIVYVLEEYTNNGHKKEKN